MPRHPVFGWGGLALVAFLSADLASACLEGHWAPLPPRSGATASSVSLQAGPDLTQVDDLRVLLSRPEVARAKERRRATEERQPGPRRSASTPCPALVGTLLNGEVSCALLQVGSEVRGLNPGEDWGSWQLLSVGESSARLRNPEGRVATVRLMQPAPPPPPPESAPQVADQEVKPLSSRRELQDLMRHPGDWLSHTHARPQTRNGTPDGVELTFSDASNPFARLGLSSGDVVLSLNARPLAGMEDFNWARSELANARRLVFQLRREGQPQTLEVELAE